MTAEEIYIQQICCNCKNKETDLCSIKRRRHDNTIYCEHYVTTLEKRKKVPVHWQDW